MIFHVAASGAPSDQVNFTLTVGKENMTGTACGFTCATGETEKSEEYEQAWADIRLSRGHLTKWTLKYANENHTVPDKRLRPWAVEVCPAEVRFNWTSGRSTKRVRIGPNLAFADGLSANP